MTEYQKARQTYIASYYQTATDENPELTRADFIKAVTKYLKEKEISVSRPTLERDLSSLQLSFSNSRNKTIKKKNPNFIQFGRNIPFSLIYKVQLVCHSHERLLYSSEKSTDISDDASSFYSKSKKIRDATTNGEFKNFFLVHLYIILSESGMEQYIATECLKLNKDLLFANPQLKCVELVFPERCLKSVLTMVQTMLQQSKEFSPNLSD